jgi:hypothetical protein
MATDIGTYQGGILRRHIRLSPVLVPRLNGMLWGRTPMRWLKGTKEPQELREREEWEVGSLGKGPL